MNLLIVDDQESVREELKEYLFQLKILPVSNEIYEAKNVSDALRVMKDEFINLVFLDIVLGTEDGFLFLENIRNYYPDTAVIIMTGYPEMKYALRAIEMHADGFLVKPINLQKLQNILLDVSKQYFKQNRDYKTQQMYYQMFEAYMHGQCMDIDFSTICREIGLIDIFKEKLAVFQIHYPITEDMGKRRKRLDEMLRNKFHECIIYSSQLGHLVILLGTNQQDDCREYLQQCLINCISGFTAGGVLRSSSYGIVNIYRMAEYAITVAESIGIKEKLFIMNDIQIREHIVRESSLQIKRLCNNKDKLRIAICDLFDKINELSLPFNGIAADFKKCGFPIASTLEESNCSSLRMRAQLMEMLFKCEEKVISEKVSQMIAYMENNYNKNITLAMTANAVNINYTYSSMVFKQEMGVSFTEYLTAIRIQKAKDLLLSTNCYTYEIGQRVGFTNDKYFIRQFKMSCGITPQEFRKMEKKT